MIQDLYSVMPGPVGWAWTSPLELSTRSRAVASCVRSVKCVEGRIDGAPTFQMLKVWNDEKMVSTSLVDAGALVD